MQELPFITIAICCYNASETIVDAIKSAQKQNWPKFEILIVDDCSTDGSVQVIEVLQKSDPRIRVIKHKKNLGVGASRNTLVGGAQGEFIAFFDDDDISLPERIRVQYRRILNYEKSTGVDLVLSYTARHKIVKAGAQKYIATLGMDQIPGPLPARVADLMLIGKPVIDGSGACASCSLMAKKSVIQRIGGFNTELRRGEDTDFNIRFALAGGHFAGISNPLVIQKTTPTIDKKIEEERRNVLLRVELHKEYLRELGWYVFVVNWVNFKFAALEGKWAKAAYLAAVLALGHPKKLFTRFYWVVLTLSRNTRTLGRTRKQWRTNS